MPQHLWPSTPASAPPCSRTGRLLFPLTLPLLSPSVLLALRPNDFHPDQESHQPAGHPQNNPQPCWGRRTIMNTTGSEIDLDLSLALKILWIELNFMVLLLALYLNQKRIT